MLYVPEESYFVNRDFFKSVSFLNIFAPVKALLEFFPDEEYEENKVFVSFRNSGYESNCSLLSERVELKGRTTFHYSELPDILTQIIDRATRCVHVFQGTYTDPHKIILDIELYSPEALTETRVRFELGTCGKDARILFASDEIHDEKMFECLENFGFFPHRDGGCHTPSFRSIVSENEEYKDFYNNFRYIEFINEKRRYFTEEALFHAHKNIVKIEKLKSRKSKMKN